MQQTPEVRSQSNRGVLILAVFAVVAIVVALVLAFKNEDGNDGASVFPNPAGSSAAPNGSIGGNVGSSAPQPAGALADSYKGTALNATFGISAPLGINFSSKDPSALKGGVTVQGPQLSGTGNFYDGTLTNGVLTITIHPTDGTYTSYTLTGELQPDGSLKGAIDIPATAHTVAQSGSWTAQPIG